ncbi:hypothetical protein [Pedobacter cryophilus]|uniref:Uncharacterized protein n=1 Tax=Pedobacter cryophilus TaxID=2571271 RepID=A0A4U1C2W4_9SPHI|nr:hypothetical protein [Pedobacter cryophilus]TKB98646.1 hypothetical protein FA046_05880 [Pedobacter cryophilus]
MEENLVLLMKQDSLSVEQKDSFSVAQHKLMLTIFPEGEYSLDLKSGMKAKGGKIMVAMETQQLVKLLEKQAFLNSSLKIGIQQAKRIAVSKQEKKEVEKPLKGFWLFLLLLILLGGFIYRKMK